jgi:hypothetical protein
MRLQLCLTLVVLAGVGMLTGATGGNVRSGCDGGLH